METKIDITDEDLDQCRRMAAGTWVRNAKRWAADQMQDVHDRQHEVVSTILIELADEGLSWSKLTEADQFKWANRIVSRLQARVQRDQKRLRSGDKELGGSSDRRVLWDVMPDQPYTIDDLLDAEPLDRDGLMELFAEWGIDYAPAKNTVDKMLAWANAPDGVSKAEVSRLLGLNDNAVTMAFYEVKRHGVERRYKKEKVTA